jgi:hypothetical protein
MKPLSLVLLLCLAAGIGARADEALVKASEEARSKRKKPTSRVITNADVKKSKGVLIDSKTATASPVPKSGPSRTELYEAEKKAKALLDETIARLEAEAAQLEKQVTALELAYYDESDLTRRDTVIAPQFREAKAALTDKQRQIDELRTPVNTAATSTAEVATATSAPPSH